MNDLQRPKLRTILTPIKYPATIALVSTIRPSSDVYPELASVPSQTLIRQNLIPCSDLCQDIKIRTEMLRSQNV